MKRLESKSVILLFITLLTFSFTYAQEKEVYTNPRFKSLAKSHKTIAILPFKASINLRPVQMKRLSKKERKNLEIKEGLGVQSALESYFLKRKAKHKFNLEFQDIEETNLILSRNNIDIRNLHQYTKKELARILKVDAIVMGKLNTSKPMSDEAAFLLANFTGIYGTTNTGDCTITINDSKSGKLLWKYKKSLSRLYGSDTNMVINTMMKKASRKFPYNKM